MAKDRLPAIINHEKTVIAVVGFWLKIRHHSPSQLMAVLVGITFPPRPKEV